MKTILLLMTLLCFSSIYAKNEGEIKRRDVELSKVEHNRKDRPRMPQRHSSVECHYENGMISIQFETPEGDATFTVTDVMTGDNATTTFNTATEFIYFIGTDPSTYLLEINTSAGNAYEGYLTLD